MGSLTVLEATARTASANGVGTSILVHGRSHTDPAQASPQAARPEPAADAAPASRAPGAPRADAADGVRRKTTQDDTITPAFSDTSWVPGSA